jgi:hypothetical protein
MYIFTMTQEELPVFEDMLPASAVDNFHKPGYFTTGALDDEGFPIGVMQFFVDGDPEKVYVASLEYIYVTPEARLESVAWNMHEDYKRLLLETKIPVSEVNCGQALDDDTRKFFLALGYKSLGQGRFMLNIPR